MRIRICAAIVAAIACILIGTAASAAEAESGKSLPPGWKDFVIEMMPYLVALGGLVLSGVIGYFGYKSGKTSLYREQLYSKQLEAQQEVFEALGNYHRRVVVTLDQLGPSLDISNRDLLAGQISEEMTTLAEVIDKWGVFICPAFGVKVTEYVELVSGIRQNPLRTQTKDAIQRLLIAFRKALDVARDDLKIQHLSKETQELIGRPIPTKE